MEAEQWRALCYRSLEIPEAESDPKLEAARRLLERADVPISVESVGAAEKALDLVVRTGRAGKLDEVFLGLEYDQFFPHDDEERITAMECTKVLLQAVVAWIELHPSESG